MVDRIVPSGSSPLLVETEAFHQWVIEDSFLEQRPAWEQPGLLFVAQVEPFELLKLRLLNAAHSFMAYYGQLRGWTYVHEAVTDPEIRPFLERLFFQEVGPSLEVPAPLSLRGYGEDLLRRFDNPALPHRLAQIAMDGSLKLPQRVLPSLAGSRVSRLCLHGWLTYMFLGLSGKRELPISDPYAQRMRETLRPSFEETVPIWLEVLGWNLPSETSLQG
jgi:fructuronate reductase